MKPGQPPEISIVICTRNRSASLDRTLRAMARLRLDGIQLELTVVDNGSTDDTATIVARFAADAPFAVAYVLEPRPGLSHARNTGLGNARGDLILFTDDDCLVTPDWAEVAVRFFDGNLLQLIGGRVEPYNPAHLTLVTKTSMERQTMRSADQILGFLHGANMMFGRPVVQRIGVFDVRLGAGTTLCSAEDTDFIYRAFVAGIPVRYEPASVIHHDDGRSGQREALRMMRGHSVGAGAMLAKWLLAGRTDLLRPIYWDFVSALNRWRNDKAQWPVLVSRLSLLRGIVLFLSMASWRRAS